MGETRLTKNDLYQARARAFDELSSRYAGLIDLGIRMHPLWGPRLRKAVAQITGPRVLEVSFGTGYVMSLYAGRFETTGVDYSPRMIDTTRKRLARLGLSADLVLGDVHALPFADESFDCLVNTDAFTLYADPHKAMSEMYRVLAPGGRLVLQEYDVPRDPNWLGMKLMALPALLGMPHVAFDPLLRSVGFDYQDHPVGLAGVLHMFVAQKPVQPSVSARPPRLIANETSVEREES